MPNKKLKTVFAASIFLMGVLTLLLGCPASPDPPSIDPIFNFESILAGDQQVPPVNTAASGSALIELRPMRNRVHWTVAWDGVESTVTGIHFHGPAVAGENADVLLDIGAVSGLTSPSGGSCAVDEEFANAMVDGKVYINLHTSSFPDGEIRGQVVSPDLNPDSNPDGNDSDDDLSGEDDILSSPVVIQVD